MHSTIGIRDVRDKLIIMLTAHLLDKNSIGIIIDTLDQYVNLFDLLFPSNPFHFNSRDSRMRIVS